MPRNIGNGLEMNLENSGNAAWIERQTQSPEARRLYEQERLIAWVTEELAGAIEDSGLTRKEIADLLGTSKANITQALQGRNLTLKTIAEIAWATNFRMCMAREPLRQGAFISCPVTIVRPFRAMVTETVEDGDNRKQREDLMDLMEAGGS